MQANDIARITFELVRTHEDRLLMRWEDDRARLLEEVWRLRRACAKHERTVGAVQREVGELRRLLLPAARAPAAEGPPRASKKRRVEPEDARGGITFDEMVRANVADAAIPAEKLSKNEEKEPASTAGSEVSGDGGGIDHPPPSAASGIRLKVGELRKPLAAGGIRAALRPTSTVLCQRARSPSPQTKVVEVVRNKAERAALPGYSCVECEKYIAVMRMQGLLRSEEEVAQMLRDCSRHKSAAGPPTSTPEGFWDLTVHTPDEWKHPRPPDFEEFE